MASILIALVFILTILFIFVSAWSQKQIFELKFRNQQLRMENEHWQAMRKLLEYRIASMEKDKSKVSLTPQAKKEQTSHVRKASSYREIRRANEAENLRIIEQEEKRKNDTDYQDRV